MTSPLLPACGVTSMIAPLRRVLVRRPATGGDWDGAGWRIPDPGLLARQHEAFCELLAGLGPQVEIADALEGQVDACYAHDSVIVTGRGAIVLRVAKPARRHEPEHVRRELEARGVEVHTYDGSELSLKGDGGPTCVTAPLLRG